MRCCRSNVVTSSGGGYGGGSGDLCVGGVGVSVENLNHLGGKLPRNLVRMDLEIIGLRSDEGG